MTTPEVPATNDPTEYGYNSAGERTWTGWSPSVPAAAEVPADEGTHEQALLARQVGAAALAKAIRSCGITVQYAFVGESELTDVISQLQKSHWFATELQKARAEERGALIEELRTIRSVWSERITDYVPSDEPDGDYWGGELSDPATKGQLWERAEESGAGLEVVGHWLVWVDPGGDCGKCAPPYGCPPGAHLTPIRNLDGILAARKPFNLLDELDGVAAEYPDDIDPATLEPLA